VKELKVHNNDTCDPRGQGTRWFESQRAAEEFIRSNKFATMLRHKAIKCNGPGCGGWFTGQAE
jgi:hypothetical protein